MKRYSMFASACVVAAQALCWAAEFPAPVFAAERGSGLGAFGYQGPTEIWARSQAAVPPAAAQIRQEQENAKALAKLKEMYSGQTVIPGAEDLRGTVGGTCLHETYLSVPFWRAELGAATKKYPGDGDLIAPSETVRMVAVRSIPEVGRPVPPLDELLSIAPAALANGCERANFFDYALFAPDEHLPLGCDATERWQEVDDGATYYHLRHAEHRLVKSGKYLIYRFEETLREAWNGDPSDDYGVVRKDTKTIWCYFKTGP